MEDGAIEPTDLAPDGRHYIASDEESWHILALDNAGTVCGCARYLAHENTISFARLGLRHSPLAKCDQWRQKLGYDPLYKCEMTILRFDSDRPNPRYEPWIEQIREELLSAPAICRTGQPAIWENEPLHTCGWRKEIFA